MDQERRIMNFRADEMLHGAPVLQEKGRGRLVPVMLWCGNRATHGRLFVLHRRNELPLRDGRREVTGEQGKFQFPWNRTEPSPAQRLANQHPMLHVCALVRRPNVSGTHKGVQVSFIPLRLRTFISATH